MYEDVSEAELKKERKAGSERSKFALLEQLIRGLSIGQKERDFLLLACLAATNEASENGMRYMARSVTHVVPEIRKLLTVLAPHLVESDANGLSRETVLPAVARGRPGISLIAERFPRTPEQRNAPFSVEMFHTGQDGQRFVSIKRNLMRDEVDGIRQWCEAALKVPVT